MANFVVANGVFINIFCFRMDFASKIKRDASDRMNSPNTFNVFAQSTQDLKEPITKQVSKKSKSHLTNANGRTYE